LNLEHRRCVKTTVISHFFCRTVSCIRWYHRLSKIMKDRYVKLKLKIKMVAFYAEWAFRNTYCRGYLFYANTSRFNFTDLWSSFLQNVIIYSVYNTRSIAAYTNIEWELSQIIRPFSYQYIFFYIFFLKWRFLIYHIISKISIC
jgi:hypothetical protein